MPKLKTTKFKATVSNQLKYHTRKMSPTQKHRPVLTFGILGTVYGISPAGEVKYFDYDWDGALAFAGVTFAGLPALDVRLGRPTKAVYLPGYDMWNPERKIGTDTKAYWVLKTEPV
jgi:hypothetical protein